MTHNCCSLLHSQCSFVIQAYIHFPNKHGGDGQHTHACGRVFGFFANGFEQSSECALMFRPKILKATKVASFVRTVCVTKKSKSETIPINDEMKRLRSEMENEKCRERMTDEDETSTLKEREGRVEAFQATSSCVIVLTLLLYSSASCGTGKCS